MSFWKQTPARPTGPNTEPPSSPGPDPQDKPLPTLLVPSPTPSLSDKPLPSKPRPGTSGTELALTSDRRAASEHLQAARKAERSYKAHKRATAARKDYAEAKRHLGLAFRHLGLGVRLVVGVVGGVPSVVRDRGERRRVERTRTGAEEKRSGDKRVGDEVKVVGVIDGMGERGADEGDTEVEVVQEVREGGEEVKK